MNKTVTVLSITTLLGISATAIPLSVSASSITSPATQQAQVPTALPSPEISSVDLVHYNTVRITLNTPLDNQYALLMTYTATDQVDYGLGEKEVLNEKGDLIGFDIDLDVIAAKSTANNTIASTLKFKIIDQNTGEMNVSSITDSTLINMITNAVNYGDIQDLGLVTDVEKSTDYSLYFEDEIYSDKILSGKITTASHSLQIDDKQMNNRNISYRVIDQDGNIVGQIRRSLPNSPTLFIFPTNGETFQKDTTYRIMVTNYSTNTTEEVFSFTPFYIF